VETSAPGADWSMLFCGRGQRSPSFPAHRRRGGPPDAQPKHRVGQPNSHHVHGKWGLPDELHVCIDGVRGQPRRQHRPCGRRVSLSAGTCRMSHTSSRASQPQQRDRPTVRVLQPHYPNPQHPARGVFEPDSRFVFGFFSTRASRRRCPACVDTPHRHVVGCTSHAACYLLFGGVRCVPHGHERRTCTRYSRGGVDAHRASEVNDGAMHGFERCDHSADVALGRA
jgi:hypothetical protein